MVTTGLANFVMKRKRSWILGAREKESKDVRTVRRYCVFVWEMGENRLVVKVVPFVPFVNLEGWRFSEAWPAAEKFISRSSSQVDASADTLMFRTHTRALCTQF